MEIIKDKKSKVGVNTHSANKIVFHALQNNLFKEFYDIIEIKLKIKFGENTRFDFWLRKKEKALIEVKSVTLLGRTRLQNFDAITSRGLKHLNELIKASKKYKFL